MFSIIKWVIIIYVCYRVFFGIGCAFLGMVMNAFSGLIHGSKSDIEDIYK